MKIDKIEAKIGYKFKDQNLVVDALTHPNYDLTIAGSDKRKKYQRLEFIGDAVLSLIVIDFLYKNYPDADEGELALMHNNAVRSESVSYVAEQIQLFEHIKFSQNDLTLNHKTNLQNSMESLIGAVYLDANNYPEVMHIFQNLWDKFLFRNANYNIKYKNPKSKLQEYTQKHDMKLPEYSVIKSEGSGHNPIFTVSVCISICSAMKNKKSNLYKFFIENYKEDIIQNKYDLSKSYKKYSLCATGQGKNKKLAEESAASNMLEKLKNIF